ncbi:hypothetical protein LZ575_18125 [Antarcticibacterium sp. 1MA-6-2]|uniref:hypothetical protein n=1 Tax=Antarcticibacterium sp. 1MA-6-2 TaxID=2908210 RepID=UPI001F227A4B|nr:hypothetical protein [Antarcticibacterium sp. 1MA-6-2]UJH90666.1 hypothetical protein LZ575_18125 [Antarcticibacterium sp. 1MA-6-2]
MKSIKLCSALILFLALTVGCEKESIESPEMELTEKQKPKNLYDFVHSGVDLEAYINKVQKVEAKSANLNKSHAENSSLDKGAVFFNTFCNNLTVEGFEDGRIAPDDAGIFYGPLNSLSWVGKFQPNEIEVGVEISSLNPDSGKESIIGLYGQKVRSSYSKVIYAQTAGDELVIRFVPNVQSVSLEILSFPYAMEAGTDGTEPTPVPIPEASQEVTIEVTFSTGLVQEIVKASFSGLFWGTTGKETISQIVLSSSHNDAWVGVDNIAFGLCEDNDADGCVDYEEDVLNDGYLNSNLEATVHLGACNSGVPNLETLECGVWMSDLFDQVEGGSYLTEGLRRNAITTVANNLVKEGLITQQQKASILGCN